MEMYTCITVENIPIWNIYDSYADLRKVIRIDRGLVYFSVNSICNRIVQLTICIDLFWLTIPNNL